MNMRHIILSGGLSIIFGIYSVYNLVQYFARNNRVQNDALFLIHKRLDDLTKQVNVLNDTISNRLYGYEQVNEEEEDVQEEQDDDEYDDQEEQDEEDKEEQDDEEYDDQYEMEDTKLDDEIEEVNTGLIVDIDGDYNNDFSSDIQMLSPDIDIVCNDKVCYVVDKDIKQEDKQNDDYFNDELVKSS